MDTSIPHRAVVQLDQVVSAKAVARRRRRGTMESTELNLSRDHEGRKKVNQYTMLETVGKGSYGKVKKCVDLGTKEVYAAKIIRKSMLKRKRCVRQCCLCVSASLCLCSCLCLRVCN